MAQAGDYFIVTLKAPHINWGTHRYTDSRPPIEGEGYIQVSASNARRFDIIRGNVYNCFSTDGNYNHPLVACGNQSDRIHAKQFESKGDLKILGHWLKDVCNAQIGDQIKVYWHSPDDIEITYIPS